MKLDSKYFDRIRVKPEEDRLNRDRLPVCDWAGCGALGAYRAPKGRNREGEYHQFCLSHVREYNKHYNYFAGMTDDDLTSWQLHSHTGHRPTWPLGENSWASHNGGRFRKADLNRNGSKRADPFGLFGAETRNAQREPPRRTVRNAELKALHKLGLDDTASPEQVKSQYKTLVKRLHPDANGGSRANEDKLKEVISAYDHLRSVGFC